MLYSCEAVSLFGNLFFQLNSSSILTRGVHDLKPHITDDQYNIIIKFVNLESESQIQEFSEWVMNTGIKKVIGKFVKCRNSSRYLTIRKFRLVESQDTERVDPTGPHKMPLEDESN